MIRAIVIDPHKRTVEERELPPAHDSQAHHIHEIIGDHFQIACTIPIPGQDPDICYVDESGLYKPNQRFFLLVGWGHEEYQGIGVIVGSKGSETVSARISLEDVIRRVGFEL